MSVFEIARGSIFVLTAINVVAFVIVSQRKPEWSAFTVVKFLIVREANLVTNLLTPGILAVIITAVLVGGGTAIFGLGEWLFYRELSVVSAFYQGEALIATLGGIGGLSLLVSYVVSLEALSDVPFFSFLTFTDPVGGKTEDVFL